MWEPNCVGNWGPSYQDIEEFFSCGYYGDYGYHYQSDNYDQQPYSPLSPYHQDNLYPDVDNRLLVSLEHGISGLSIADSNQSPHAVHEHVQASDYPVGQCETFPTNQDSYNGSSSLNYNYGELFTKYHKNNEKHDLTSFSRYKFLN